MAEIKISEVEYNKLLSQIDDLKNEVKMLKNEQNVEKQQSVLKNKYLDCRHLIVIFQISTRLT